MNQIIPKTDIGHKSSYSKIQYFFWLVSGCEISILKECPTDYNRQAGIGFTIFMTTVFAAFAGGTAGYYFSHSWFAALIFGMIWGLLVFSIDRTLVVTIKKDPAKPKWHLWAAFGGRMVLAGLIAFIISIPLELLIFKDQISIQRRIDAQQTVGTYKGMIENNGRLTDKKSRAEQEGSAAAEASREGQNMATDPAWLDINARLQPVVRAFNVAERREGDYYRRYQQYLLINDKGATADAFRKSSEYKNVMAEYARLKREKKNIQDELQREASSYRKLKETEQTAHKKTRDSLNTIVGQIGRTADTSGSKMEALFSDSFIRDYVALENAAYETQTIKVKGKPDETTYKNGSLLFLIWLIRILFFIIELLPTGSKIVTPMGAYDRAIIGRESDFEQELKDKTGDYLGQQKKLRDMDYVEELRQEQVRLRREGKLHDDLVKEVADAQHEVARKRIEAFKKKHSYVDEPVP